MLLKCKLCCGSVSLGQGKRLKLLPNDECEEAKIFREWKNVKEKELTNVQMKIEI
jgi:hypothetical protein